LCGEAVGGAEFVAEFDEFWELGGDDVSGVYVDEEGVSGLSDRELVVGLLASDEDVLDDSCGFEEFECAVDSGFGDGVALGFEGVEELVGFEEGVEIDDGVEDFGALGGVLESLGFEGSAEDGAEWLDELGLIGAGGVFGRLFDRLERHGGFYAKGSRLVIGKG
jgi:hypothetical protein